MLFKKKKNTTVISTEETVEEDKNPFFENRNTVKELVACNGVNTAPLHYMEVDDNGIKIYTMCFYIDKLPRKVTFATTFAPLFNFPEITSNVFINPLADGKSIKKLDKRIISLDTERVAAEDAGDRNRLRKIQGKLDNAEQFADDVESGDNKLYEVSFLFILQSVELERLRLIVSDFLIGARERGVELASCYGVHPEAFVSGYPTNKIFKAESGLVKSSVIKTFVFDKKAITTIFNHTRSTFFHADGIFLGHNMSTGHLLSYDVYDKSHKEGYNVVVTGKTGTGKSATIKMYNSRAIDFGYKIRSIDYESKGSRGEYSIMADGVDGVNYQVKQGADTILNFFELDEEIILDEVTGKEYRTLEVSQKVENAVYIMMTIIKGERKIDKFIDDVTLTRIVTDTIAEMYNERGIFDGDADSLYTTETIVQNSRFSSGKVKKELPTISEFYKKILIARKENTDAVYENAYRIILDTVKDYIKELYYSSNTICFYTAAEYEKFFEQSKKEEKNKVYDDDGNLLNVVKGTRSYFDGQSTIRVDHSTPHLNIDISGLSKREKPIALLVATAFMEELCIKKNSINPLKAEKMILLIDEVHRVFKFPEAREFITDAYRVARKRNVSVWSATQALSDFYEYDDAKAIVKNSATIILLKQDQMDRKFLQENTILTDVEVERVLSLGGDLSEDGQTYERQGELCMIENQSKVVFLKVDYLTDSESRIVETDINKIKKLYKGGGVNIA